MIVGLSSILNELINGRNQRWPVYSRCEIKIEKEVNDDCRCLVSVQTKLETEIYTDCRRIVSVILS